jgi:hypothetical protein
MQAVGHHSDYFSWKKLNRCTHADIARREKWNSTMISKYLMLTLLIAKPFSSASRMWRGHPPQGLLPCPLTSCCHQTRSLEVEAQGKASSLSHLLLHAAGSRVHWPLVKYKYYRKFKHCKLFSTCGGRGEMGPYQHYREFFLIVIDNEGFTVLHFNLFWRRLRSWYPTKKSEQSFFSFFRLFCYMGKAVRYPSILKIPARCSVLGMSWGWIAGPGEEDDVKTVQS